MGAFTGIVLAAGFGERLGGRPKAFLPLGGSTAIDRAVKALEAAGASSLRVVHSARWAASFDRWGRERNGARRVDLLNDGAFTNDTRLGAAGSLRFAMNGLREDALVLAVDTVFTWPAAVFMDRLLPAEAAVAVRSIRRGYEELGRVDLDEWKVVRNFYDGARPDGERPWAPWVWLGPAWLPAGAGEDVARYCLEESRAGRLPDSLGGLVSWLARRRMVRGVVVDDGDAWDVGTPQGLAAAQSVVGS